jgi:hypothetical protein
MSHDLLVMGIPLWLWMSAVRDRCSCTTDLGVSLAQRCCMTKDAAALCMYEVRRSCKTHSLDLRSIQCCRSTHSSKHFLMIELEKRGQPCQAHFYVPATDRRSEVRGRWHFPPLVHLPTPACTAKSTVLRTPARIRMGPSIVLHTFLYGQAHRDDHSGRVEGTAYFTSIATPPLLCPRGK